MRPISTVRVRARFPAVLAGAAFVAALLLGRPAFADGPPPPPPPPPPPAGDATPPTGGAPASGGGANGAPANGSTASQTTAGKTTASPTTGAPAPGGANGQPPPPPPPKVAIGSWDQDWRSRDVDLGPPLPPPDPYAPRHIPFRHDARDVSADGVLKEEKRVPQWVDVIDRAELTEWRPLDIGDLARRLPNVIVSDGGSPYLQIPNIRGFGADRVKILTDGVWPTSQALGLLGGSLSLWDPESTERVEVYHGPGAYLKSIDSPGGVFNIVPRRPRRHGILTADVGLSSSYLSSTGKFRQRAEADVGSGRIAALVGLTWTDVGNIHTPDGSVVPSDWSEYAVDVALDYFLDNQSTIGITFQHVNAFDVSAPLGTGLSTGGPQFERTFIALTLSSFDMGNVFHGHRMSIALDTFLTESDDAFSNQTTGLGTKDDLSRFAFHLEGNLYLIPCHETWAELDVSYAHLNRTETLLCNPQPPVVGQGGGKESGSVSSLIDSGTSGPWYAVPGQCNTVIQSYEAEEIVISGLLEDQFHTECCDRQAGIRVDWYHYEDNRPGAVNDDRFLVDGAVGVARHFTSCLTGYTNGSFGWRRPTIHERTANVVYNGKTIIGNPDLDPEFHANAELGIKASRLDRASIEAGVFAHYTNDYIGEHELNPPAANQVMLQNLGDAFLYGFELTGAWRPNTTIEGWELFGNLSLTNSTDDALVHGLPLLYRVGSRFSVPQPQGYVVRRWFAELALDGATRSINGPTGGDPYVTADALVGLGIDLGCRKAGTVNVGITNLFDARYVQPGCVLPAPGLGLIASVSLNF